LRPSLVRALISSRSNSASPPHRQHQLPVRRRGVGPTIGERAKARARLADYVEHIEQIARRAGEPV